MLGRNLPRGERAVRWIEKYCVVPSGFERGQHVRLTQAQRNTIRKIYDAQNISEVVGEQLGAYLALLHVCGPEALQKEFRPDVAPDIFTVWNSVGPDLRTVLKREGEHVVCPELGTCYPTAA
jgi:hypothetical protein